MTVSSDTWIKVKKKGHGVLFIHQVVYLRNRLSVAQIGQPQIAPDVVSEVRDESRRLPARIGVDVDELKLNVGRYDHRKLRKHVLIIVTISRSTREH